MHGEVSLFDRTRTIDHVAHAGPCESPEYIVFLDMKLSLNQDLIDQMSWADVGHYVDAYYVVTPRKRGYDTTHKTWKAVHERKWYHRPGWIIVDGDTIDIVEDCCLLNPKYQKRNTYRILLTDQNKDSLAGYRSGHIDVDTHWKAGVRYVQAKMSEQDFSFNKLVEDCPSFLKAYKNPRQALSRMHHHLNLPKILKRARKK